MGNNLITKNKSSEWMNGLPSLSACHIILWSNLTFGKLNICSTTQRYGWAYIIGWWCQVWCVHFVFIARWWTGAILGWIHNKLIIHLHSKDLDCTIYAILFMIYAVFVNFHIFSADQHNLQAFTQILFQLEWWDST